MKKTVATIALALPILLLGCTANKSQQSKKSSRVVVTNEKTIAQTIYGKVQGYLDGDVFTFKGIPYAKAERFMPPTAPDKHDSIVKCRLYGPKAPQTESLEWQGLNQTDYAFGNQFVHITKLTTVTLVEYQHDIVLCQHLTQSFILLPCFRLQQVR